MSSSALRTQVYQALASNTFNADTTTPIYSAGVWSFKNSTAVTSVTITDAGNVGIGTSSPARRLHINSSALGSFMQFTDSASGSTASDGLLLGFYSTDAEISNQEAGPIVFRTNNTERMRIDASGRFMVGATSSDYIFRANGFSHFGDAYDAGLYGAVQISRPQATSNKFHLACISSGLQVCGLGFLNNSNTFAVNNASSSSNNGVSLANGGTSWSPLSSDIRKKKNFETTQGLAEVLQIEPVKYHLLDDEDTQSKRLGFKAQNLQPLIPEMVIPNGQKAEDGSDYLTITPDYLLPVLVKAIQELSTKVDFQDREIRRLKGEVVEEPTAPAPVVEPTPAPAVEQFQSVAQPEPEPEEQSATQPEPVVEVQPVAEPENP